MQNLVAEQQKTIRSKLFNWLLAIISLAILVIQCAEPVRSNDLWWHMAIGRNILATGQFIVDHSIFTWTEATPYHIYNAWLSEIALYLIYITTGSIGLIALRYLIFGGFFALAVYFAINRGIVYNPLAWLIIAIGINFTFSVKFIEPGLFSFAFTCIIVWLYFLIRTIGIKAWKLFYLFPIIIILWINSHGAFVMSTLFFISIGMGELLNVKFDSQQALPIKLRIHLFIALALCIIALLINPFGYHLPLYLLQSTLTIKTEVAKFATNIRGWDTTFKYNVPPYYAINYLLVAIVIYLFLTWQQLRNRRIDCVSMLAFTAYSILFLVMLRTTNFLTPVFVFASLDLLAYKENSWAWSNIKQVRIAIAISSAILIGIIGYNTVLGTVCYTYRSTLWGGALIDKQYVVEEAEYISHMQDVTNIGNLYEDGGYLMFRLWPAKRTMIDPRYFPFTAWIEQFLAFEQGYGISKFLDHYKADVWLINHENAALMEWFNNSKMWAPVFIGSAGVVFAHTSGSMVAKLNISPNVGQTDGILSLKSIFSTALILKNWSLAEQISNQTASLAKSRPWCEKQVSLNRDLQRALIGMKAFYAGDYVTTASNLSEETDFLNLTNIATAAHTLLAQRAWNNNDYVTARASTIEALRLQPKNVTNVYNAAIADWQYRISAPATIALIKDDITWQFLVDILLKHKEKIPSTQTFIIDIFIAMRNGTLHEKPPFITPPVSVRQ